MNELPLGKITFVMEVVSLSQWSLDLYLYHYCTAGWDCVLRIMDTYMYILFCQQLVDQH